MAPSPRSHVTVDPVVWARVRHAALDRGIPSVRLLDRLIALGFAHEAWMETQARLGGYVTVEEARRLNELDGLVLRDGDTAVVTGEPVDVGGDSQEARPLQEVTEGMELREVPGFVREAAKTVEAEVTAQLGAPGVEARFGLGLRNPATTYEAARQRDEAAMRASSDRWTCSVDGGQWPSEELHDAECGLHAVKRDVQEVTGSFTFQADEDVFVGIDLASSPDKSTYVITQKLADGTMRVVSTGAVEGETLGKVRSMYSFANHGLRLSLSPAKPLPDDVLETSFDDIVAAVVPVKAIDHNSADHWTPDELAAVGEQILREVSVVEDTPGNRDAGGGHVVAVHLNHNDPESDLYEAPPKKTRARARPKTGPTIISDPKEVAAAVPPPTKLRDGIGAPRPAPKPQPRKRR